MLSTLARDDEEDDIVVQLRNVRHMVESWREEMANGEALASDKFLKITVVRTFTAACRRGIPLEDDEMEVVALKDATDFLSSMKRVPEINFGDFDDEDNGDDGDAARTARALDYIGRQGYKCA